MSKIISVVFAIAFVNSCAAVKLGSILNPDDTARLVRKAYCVAKEVSAEIIAKNMTNARQHEVDEYVEECLSNSILQKDTCMQALKMSEFSFCEIVEAFRLILEEKLFMVTLCRVDASAQMKLYSIKYIRQDIVNEDSEDRRLHVDPCFSNIEFGGKYFQLSSNYDGGSSQVGNSVIREFGADKKALKWKETERGDNYALRFILFALEVARRLPKDVLIDGSMKRDLYCDLPVLPSIAMAKRAKIVKCEKMYKCFWGDKSFRKAAITGIIIEYLHCLDVDSGDIRDMLNEDGGIDDEKFCNIFRNALYFDSIMLLAQKFSNTSRL